MMRRDASVAIVGAGDAIGAAIARKFATEGDGVLVGRRNHAKLDALAADIRRTGGQCKAMALDARIPDQVAAFIDEAETIGPLEVCVFNVGGNVDLAIAQTSDRIFRKVWEMACFAGFVTGREAARVMLPRSSGSIFFTGATASWRGAAGFSAFGSAKAGLRAVAQSMARELGPKQIHVAHLVIDAAVDSAFARDFVAHREGAAAAIVTDRFMRPEAVAETYWSLHNQSPDAWTFELDIRPFGEKW